jgi:hypothetical protein
MLLKIYVKSNVIIKIKVKLRQTLILTLSSPVMPCDIILLILSFICYSFGGLSIPKMLQIFGLERVKG